MPGADDDCRGVRRQARVETLFACSRTRGVSCGHDTGSGPTAPGGSHVEYRRGCAHAMGSETIIGHDGSDVDRMIVDVPMTAHLILGRDAQTRVFALRTPSFGFPSGRPAGLA